MKGSIVWRVVGVSIIVIIIAAIAIPNLLLSKRGASVCAAVGDLWALQTAQEKYKYKYGKYATLQELSDEGYINGIAIDAAGNTFSSHGYCFELTLVCPDTWYCTAKPSEWEVGLRNFLITDKRLIYYNTIEDCAEFVKEADENAYKDQ